MTPLSAIWLLVAASGRADDSTTGFAWSAALRVPLVDSADPLPWQGTGRPPVGAMRLDILPGASLNAASGWEADFHARVSGYAMAWADETIQPGHRGGLEVAVRKFVPPNNEREDFGIWTGGYAGGSVMAEVWGRHDPGLPKLGTLHVVVGYRGLAHDVQPAFLEMGVGAWGDRGDGSADITGGAGFVVRAGLEFFQPARGFGTR